MRAQWKRGDVTSGLKPGQLLRGFDPGSSLCSHLILENHKVGWASKQLLTEAYVAASSR